MADDGGSGSRRSGKGKGRGGKETRQQDRAAATWPAASCGASPSESPTEADNHSSDGESVGGGPSSGSSFEDEEEEEEEASEPEPKRRKLRKPKKASVRVFRSEERAPWAKGTVGCQDYNDDCYLKTRSPQVFQACMGTTDDGAEPVFCAGEGDEVVDVMIENVHFGDVFHTETEMWQWGVRDEMPRVYPRHVIACEGCPVGGFKTAVYCRSARRVEIQPAAQCCNNTHKAKRVIPFPVLNSQMLPTEPVDGNGNSQRVKWGASAHNSTWKQHYTKKKGPTPTHTDDSQPRFVQGAMTEEPDVGDDMLYAGDAATESELLAFNEAADARIRKRLSEVVKKRNSSPTHWVPHTKMNMAIPFEECIRERKGVNKRAPLAMKTALVATGGGSSCHPVDLAGDPSSPGLLLRKAKVGMLRLGDLEEAGKGKNTAVVVNTNKVYEGLPKPPTATAEEVEEGFPAAFEAGVMDAPNCYSMKGVKPAKDLDTTGWPWAKKPPRKMTSTAVRISVDGGITTAEDVVSAAEAMAGSAPEGVEGSANYSGVAARLAELGEALRSGGTSLDTLPPIFPAWRMLQWFHPGFKRTLNSLETHDDDTTPTTEQARANVKALGKLARKATDNIDPVACWMEEGLGDKRMFTVDAHPISWFYMPEGAGGIPAMGADAHHVTRILRAVLTSLDTKDGIDRWGRLRVGGVIHTLRSLFDEAGRAQHLLLGGPEHFLTQRHRELQDIVGRARRLGLLAQALTTETSELDLMLRTRYTADHVRVHDRRLKSLELANNAAHIIMGMTADNPDPEGEDITALDHQVARLLGSPNPRPYTLPELGAQQQERVTLRPDEADEDFGGVPAESHQTLGRILEWSSTSFRPPGRRTAAPSAPAAAAEPEGPQGGAPATPTRSSPPAAAAAEPDGASREDATAAVGERGPKRARSNSLDSSAPGGDGKKQRNGEGADVSAEAFHIKKEKTTTEEGVEEEHDEETGNKQVKTEVKVDGVLADAPFQFPFPVVAEKPAVKSECVQDGDASKVPHVKEERYHT